MSNDIRSSTNAKALAAPLALLTLGEAMDEVRLTADSRPRRQRGGACELGCAPRRRVAARVGYEPDGAQRLDPQVPPRRPFA